MFVVVLLLQINLRISEIWKRNSNLKINASFSIHPEGNLTKLANPSGGVTFRLRKLKRDDQGSGTNYLLKLENF